MKIRFFSVQSKFTEKKSFLNGTRFLRFQLFQIKGAYIFFEISDLGGTLVIDSPPLLFTENDLQLTITCNFENHVTSLIIGRFWWSCARWKGTQYYSSKKKIRGDWVQMVQFNFKNIWRAHLKRYWRVQGIVGKVEPLATFSPKTLWIWCSCHHNWALAQKLQKVKCTIWSH